MTPKVFLHPVSHSRLICRKVKGEMLTKEALLKKKDRQYYASYRGTGTVRYLRFNEAVRFFTQRVSSRLKICSLALPLCCLCVIITTCSMLFFSPLSLSLLYIHPFLYFLLSIWLLAISHSSCFFGGRGCQLLPKWSGLKSNRSVVEM